MGLWWKTVNFVPKAGGYEIKGDTNAFDKNAFPWGGWRIQHNWQIFQVRAEFACYQVMFDNGTIMMQTRRSIKTPRFAVRIGREQIRFIAIGQDDTVLPIEPMGPVLNYQEMKKMQKVAQLQYESTYPPDVRITMV